MDKESFQARKEIARRKVDQALWVKAMSQSKGDKNEAKKRYVEIRSEQLKEKNVKGGSAEMVKFCLLYTSPSPRDATLSRMPSSA